MRLGSGRRGVGVGLLALGLVGCSVVDDVLGSLRPCAGVEAGSAYAFHIDEVQVLQIVEARDGGVPLISGRPATARVLARYDGEGRKPLDTPVAVEVHGYRDGASLGSVPADGPDCVPIAPTLAELDATYNATIPAAWLEPEGGLELVATLGVGGGDAPLPRQELRHPATGTIGLRTVAAQPFDITFVPITLEDQTVDLTPDDAERYLALARKVLPLGDVDIEIRTPYALEASDTPLDEVTAVALQELREL